MQKILTGKELGPELKWLQTNKVTMNDLVLDAILEPTLMLERKAYEVVNSNSIIINYSVGYYKNSIRIQDAIYLVKLNVKASYNKEYVGEAYDSNILLKPTSTEVRCSTNLGIFPEYRSTSRRRKNQDGELMLHKYIDTLTLRVFPKLYENRLG